jgi:hypothetical protein
LTALIACRLLLDVADLIAATAHQRQGVMIYLIGREHFWCKIAAQ